MYVYIYVYMTYIYKRLIDVIQNNIYPGNYKSYTKLGITDHTP